MSTGHLMCCYCFVDCCCNLSLSCSALQSEADVQGMVETVTECLDKVFFSRYGASLLPSYGVCETFSFQLAINIIIKYFTNWSSYVLYGNFVLVLMHIDDSTLRCMFFFQTFIQAGLLTDSKDIRKLACKAVCIWMCFLSGWHFANVAVSVDSNLCFLFWTFEKMWFHLLFLTLIYAIHFLSAYYKFFFLKKKSVVLSVCFVDWHGKCIKW